MEAGDRGWIGLGAGLLGTASAATITVTAPNDANGFNPGHNNDWPFTYTLDENADPNAELFFSVEPLLGTPFVLQKVVLNQDGVDENGDRLGDAGTHTISIGPLSTLATDDANVLSVEPADGSDAFDIPHSSPSGVMMSIKAQFTGDVSGATSPARCR